MLTPNHDGLLYIETAVAELLEWLLDSEPGAIAAHHLRTIPKEPHA